MERRRVRGRFVREGDGCTKQAEQVRAPRPGECRSFVLKQLAAALPDLIETLIEQAKDGSYQHMTILARLAGLLGADNGEDVGKKRRRGNGVMARLMKELQKEATAEREAKAEKDAAGAGKEEVESEQDETGADADERGQAGGRRI